MWWWLGAAVVTEVCATLELRYTNGFSRPGPVAVVAVGYALAFFALSQAIRLGMPEATAYAAWSVIGIAAIAVLGHVMFNEPLTRLQILGLVLVALGVAALQRGRTTG